MGAGRPERPEARQGGINSAAGRHATKARAPRMARTKHRLAQVAVGMFAALPAWQKHAFGFFGSSERLFRPVVDARNTQGEKLHRHARDNLLLRCRFTREPDLDPEDMVVIVEDRDVPLAKIAVRAHLRVARIEAAKVRLRVRQAFGDVLEGGPHVTDVERSVQVAPEDVEEPVLSEIAARYFADQQEIGLSQIRREFLDRAAEVAPLLERHMLQRINAEAVAVAQRDPILVTIGEVV